MFYLADRIGPALPSAGTRAVKGLRGTVSSERFLRNGPKRELVAGGGDEDVMIADEGSANYDDSQLLKIGKHGSLRQIPQNHVICFHKAFRGSVNYRGLLPIR